MHRARERSGARITLRGAAYPDAGARPSAPPPPSRREPSRRELIERIAAAYGVDLARAAEGADLYLRQLHRAGLLAGH